jgi:2-haloacid dehalogenase
MPSGGVHTITVVSYENRHPDARGVTAPQVFPCPVIGGPIKTMPSALAIVKQGDLPLGTLLAADLARNQKPSPTVYRMAVDELNVEPKQMLMVSAYEWDLQAAKSCGLGTAFVPRPKENGPNTMVDEAAESYIDVMANDLVSLAAKLMAA